MRGFPKNLNTKQDFLNCLTDYPEQTKAKLQELLDNRYVWQDTAILGDDDEGVEDETHRIIEDEDGARTQQEYAEDTRAKIFRLGFTTDEAEELIND